MLHRERHTPKDERYIFHILPLSNTIDPSNLRIRTERSDPSTDAALQAAAFPAIGDNRVHSRIADKTRPLKA